MKQIWDGLIMEHPVISVVGALLVVALTCGGVGAGALERRLLPAAPLPFSRHGQLPFAPAPNLWHNTHSRR